MSITVKLSDYERALNQLNNIPAKQARIFEAALASLKQQRDEAREALEEREADVHARIRAGYDRTVADSWRAKVAEVERERDEARAELTKESECADNAIEWQRRYYEAQSTVMQLRADVRNLVKALRGYHRAADSWPYARWSAEMHAAEAVLESVGMAGRK